MCGGFDSFSLYDLAEAPLPTPPTDDNYVGCFADDRHDRVLGAKTSSSSMTSEVAASVRFSTILKGYFYVPRLIVHHANVAGVVYSSPHAQSGGIASTCDIPRKRSGFPPYYARY